LTRFVVQINQIERQLTRNGLRWHSRTKFSGLQGKFDDLVDFHLGSVSSLRRDVDDGKFKFMRNHSQSLMQTWIFSRIPLGRSSSIPFHPNGSFAIQGSVFSLTSEPNCKIIRVEMEASKALSADKTVWAYSADTFHAGLYFIRINIHGWCTY
jgi:hypothetical protein